MGILRSVGGREEVDLDQRAITTDDDIVDLSELDRSPNQSNAPAPPTQNGAGEPSDGQPPAAASKPHRTPRKAQPASDAPGLESDQDFDRWVGDRASELSDAVAASKPGTLPLGSDAREPVSGDAPGAGSGTAEAACEELTLAPLTSSRGRLRRSGARSRQLGRFARPAAVIAAIALTAGGTALAINAATTGTAHERRPVATSNAAALLGGPSNRAGATLLSATIAGITPELHVLGRAVRHARSTSHPHHATQHHRPRRRTGISGHHRQATVGEHSTASSQTSPPAQTYDNTPAPATSSSASQATAGSQAQATSTSQPAFGQNGTLGPGRGGPGTQ